MMSALETASYDWASAIPEFWFDSTNNIYIYLFFFALNKFYHKLFNIYLKSALSISLIFRLSICDYQGLGKNSE